MPFTLPIPVQAFQPAARGLTADAGVHDLVSVPLSLQSRRKQRDPTLLWPDSESGAQTIAEDKDRTVGSHRVLERDEHQPDAQRSGADSSQQRSQG